MFRLLAAAAVLLLAAVACGNGEEPGGGNTVNAQLADFSITTDVSSVAPGSVTFVAKNNGPSEHEVVVLRTDLAPDALPVEGGAVDEKAPGMQAIGEIEEFGAGGTESAALDLTAGNYVLICNIPAHYEAGMAVALEVA